MLCEEDIIVEKTSYKLFIYSQHNRRYLILEPKVLTANYSTYQINSLDQIKTKLKFSLSSIYNTNFVNNAAKEEANELNNE